MAHVATNSLTCAADDSCASVKKRRDLDLISYKSLSTTYTPTYLQIYVQTNKQTNKQTNTRAFYILIVMLNLAVISVRS